MSLMSVSHLSGGYRDVPVLSDVTLELQEGRTTCLVGANGVGKTTFLRGVMGQLHLAGGTVVYDGRDITRVPAYRKAAMGLVLVPEGRQLFPSLTVEENLDLGATPGRARPQRRHNLEWVLELFPRLHERLRQRAGTLSGGEQQMLAIGRGLMAAPRILMLDEPSLGLAPVMVLTLYDVIRELKAAGMTMLLVEQNVTLAMSVSDQAYVMSQGTIALSGLPRDLEAMPEVRHAYLGV